MIESQSRMTEKLGRSDQNEIKVELHKEEDVSVKSLLIYIINNIKYTTNYTVLLRHKYTFLRKPKK